MNDSLPGIILACTLRGTLLIAVAALAGPWVRRLFGHNGAHWLWLAVLPVLLWPLPPQTPWSVRSLWSAPKNASVAAQRPPEATPAEADAGPLIVKIRKLESVSPMVEGIPGARDAVRADASASAARGSSSWNRWLSGGWALGAVFFLGQLCWRWWRTLHLLRDARPITDERVLRVLARYTKRGRIGVAETASVRAPALAGIWRPRILIPAGWLAELSEAEIESVLLHELGHQRRADLVWEWLYAITRCLHWMNPVVWMAERMARQEREIACDAWAVERSKSPEEYGEALLDALKRMRRGPAPASFGIAAMAAEDARQMARRLKWIARGSSSPRWLAALSWMPGLAALLVIGSDPVAAQTRPPAPPAAPVPIAEENTAPREKAALTDAPLPLAKRTVEARTRILRVPETLAKKLGWPIAEEGSKGVAKLLSAEEFHGIVATLQATPEVELLPGPRLMARSGYPGQFQSVREFRFGRDYKSEAGGFLAPAKTKSMPLGLSLAWQAAIKDAATVDLDFTAALLRLRGFEDGHGNLAKLPTPPAGTNWTHRLVACQMPAGTAGEPSFSEQKAEVHLAVNTAQVALVFGFRDHDRIPAPGASQEQTMVNYFAVQIDIVP